MNSYKITKKNDDFLLFVDADCRLDAFLKFKILTGNFWDGDKYHIEEILD